MKHELIVPNLHVILVHYPLGLLVVGVLIELFSFLWRRSGFRVAGRWMILLGALSSVPAAFSGIYALRDVAFPHDAVDPTGPWVETVKSSPLSADAWQHLTRHVWLQGASTSLAVIAVVLWIACSDIWRRRLHMPILILLLASVGLTGVGAWFAGEAIYRERVGIETRTVASESKTPAPSATTVATSEPTSLPAAEVLREDPQNLHAWVQYIAPPLQTHVTLAGFAVAIACASIGLSIRRMVQLASAERQFGDLAATLGSQTSGGDDLSALNETYMHRPTAASSQSQNLRDVAEGIEFTPAARFWVLTFFVALCTSLSGAWYLGIDFGSCVPKDLWDLIYNDFPERKRRFVHVVGGSIVVLTPLILALLARFAPRRKIVFSFFTLLLLAAVASQMWVGVLMLYDTVSGPVPAWNK